GRSHHHAGVSGSGWGARPVGNRSAAASTTALMFHRYTVITTKFAITTPSQAAGRVSHQFAVSSSRSIAPHCQTPRARSAADGGSVFDRTPCVGPIIDTGPEARWARRAPLPRWLQSWPRGSPDAQPATTLRADGRARVLGRGV